MRNKKQYRIDLWLFLASTIVLIYILFMNYVFINKWENESLKAIMELISIPMILIGSIVPLIVVYRFISKKTESRTLSMLAVLLSLVTALLISYLTF
ncbi:MAG: hypothetical protein ACSHXF_07160 [Aquaticitalea sp.]